MIDIKNQTFPDGRFFGGGYDGTFPSDGLGSDKKSGSLGIITKLQAFQAGQGFQQDKHKSPQTEVELFALQDLAIEALSQKEKRTKNGQSYYTYVHRVNYCLRQRVDSDRLVSVRYNPNRQKAHYDNLQRCGSVWTCPFCARQITEGRRAELNLAMANWRKKGGYVYLVTLTNRHHQGDDLEELLKGQQKALTKLWEKNSVKKMMKTLGCQGRITATEVTYGANGWHPHYHLLMFFDHEINTQGLQSFLSLHWVDACTKAKLKAPSLEHGVDVQKGDKAQEYVAKWGLDHEMTKGHLKKGKKDGLTPFDLLRQSHDNPKYKKLFRQFADVFKGKKQLHWSNGLKDMLGVCSLTDEELAQQTERQSIEIQQVANQIWRLVLRYKLRGKYLQACELDYLDDGQRVYDLIMAYAVIEQQRIIATERGGGGVATTDRPSKGAYPS